VCKGRLGTAQTKEPHTETNVARTLAHYLSERVPPPPHTHTQDTVWARPYKPSAGRAPPFGRLRPPCERKGITLHCMHTCFEAKDKRQSITRVPCRTNPARLLVCSFRLIEHSRAATVIRDLPHRGFRRGARRDFEKYELLDR
jgi:hypothetical protein